LVKIDFKKGEKTLEKAKKNTLGRVIYETPYSKSCGKANSTKTFDSFDKIRAQLK